jgi:predicted nucleic acid-binding protein
MRIALDTNILAYAEGINDLPRKKVVLNLLEKLPKDETFVPVQVLGELFNVMVREAGLSPQRARTVILSWRDTFSLIETSPAVLIAATDLAAHHKLGIWDSVILSAAAAAGCRLLLSEDLQDGFTWNGVTVANPFSEKKHELLGVLLEN